MSSTDEEIAALEAIRAPEVFGPAEADDAPLSVDDIEEATGEAETEALPPVEQISRDAFFEVFKMAFSAPGIALPALRPMAVQEGEEPQARAASDAIYRLLEIYFPAALMPGSETLACLMTAAPFVIGKVMVVRAALAAQAAKPVNGATPEPANTNRPPVDPDDGVGELGK